MNKHSNENLLAKYDLFKNYRIHLRLTIISNKNYLMSYPKIYPRDAALRIEEVFYSTSLSVLCTLSHFGNRIAVKTS